MSVKCRVEAPSTSVGEGAFDMCAGGTSYARRKFTTGARADCARLHIFALVGPPGGSGGPFWHSACRLEKHRARAESEVPTKHQELRVEEPLALAEWASW